MCGHYGKKKPKNITGHGQCSAASCVNVSKCTSTCLPAFLAGASVHDIVLTLN